MKVQEIYEIAKNKIKCCYLCGECFRLPDIAKLVEKKMESEMN